MLIIIIINSPQSACFCQVLTEDPPGCGAHDLGQLLQVNYLTKMLLLCMAMLFSNRKVKKHIDINQVSYLLGSLAEHQQNIGLYGSFTTLSAVLGWVEQIQITKT